MKIDFSKYDFIDYGCSTGTSIQIAQKLFDGINGLGLDIDPSKVELAKKNGFDAEVCDVTKLAEFNNEVRFVIMSHFLEHLPGSSLAKKCIESACHVAKDFVFIQQPFFDSDGLLMQKRLKLYWSHWRGHQYHMTTLEFQNFLSEFKAKGLIDRYAILGDQKIHNSSDVCIHPLVSPIDSQKWDASVHPDKPQVNFDFPCYKSTKALMTLNASIDFDVLLNRIPRHYDIILDSKFEQ